MLSYVYIVVLLTLLQYQLCSSSVLKKECCIKFPKAMDINTFQTRVATGDDWAAILSFTCPFNAQMAAIEQFRVSMNMTNGVLTRTINYRPKSGDPCVGAINVSFDQVGSGKAVFRQERADGLIREDRYLDTGSLDDYYMLFSCQDRASARRGRCFNYVVVIDIRVDPPRNFPWDKAIYDLKRFGIDARELILRYKNEICPVT